LSSVAGGSVQGYGSDFSLFDGGGCDAESGEGQRKGDGELHFGIGDLVEKRFWIEWRMNWDLRRG